MGPIQSHSLKTCVRSVKQRCHVRRHPSSTDSYDSNIRAGKSPRMYRTTSCRTCGRRGYCNIHTSRQQHHQLIQNGTHNSIVVKTEPDRPFRPVEPGTGQLTGCDIFLHIQSRGTFSLSCRGLWRLWIITLAVFKSVDAAMARDKKERISAEQHCLARDIVNIVACKGKERVEGHELFGKWRMRFVMAGFRQLPLSAYVNSVIRGLLGCYSEHYTLVEKDGAMLLGWKGRDLVSASAWC
ncbi:GRAS family transcription factor [Striga asiatica]|uniref:GRAS family transcription factor n=1 Tax=Striga asiatica TaxID=4170 RepID=A0A5A7QSE2_STRAF|nr:GRAS family transcription factor [Striga asiatica]